VELEQDEQDRMRLLDLWNFQCREIEERAAAGEDEELEAEKRSWPMPRNLRRGDQCFRSAV